MTKATKAMIASAAIAGLITGSVATRAFAGNVGGKAGVQTSIQLNDEAKSDKNACKGKNSCKGKGGCKTDKNECKGKNACMGNGGCATGGSKDKQDGSKDKDKKE